MAEEEITKLKNVDEGLNQLIIRKYEEVITCYSEQDYIKTYDLLKSLFYLIEPYDFTKKLEIREIIQGIEEYKQKMTTAGSLNKASVIKMGQKQYEFSRLVDELYRQMPKAFSELNKWMAIVKQHNDLDAQISEEVFNTDVSLIEIKRKELSKLSSEKILKLASNNMINAMHSRHLINEGV